MHGNSFGQGGRGAAVVDTRVTPLSPPPATTVENQTALLRRWIQSTNVSVYRSDGGGRESWEEGGYRK